MQITASRQSRCNQRHERWFHEAAFVVPRLVPRVGKINVNARERTRCNHVRQHVHGVVVNYTHVCEGLFIEQVAQIAEF